MRCDGVTASITSSSGILQNQLFALEQKHQFANLLALLFDEAGAVRRIDRFLNMRPIEGLEQKRKKEKKNQSLCPIVDFHQSHALEIIFLASPFNLHVATNQRLTFFFLTPVTLVNFLDLPSPESPHVRFHHEPLRHPPFIQHQRQ